MIANFSNPMVNPSSGQYVGIHGIKMELKLSFREIHGVFQILGRPFSKSSYRNLDKGESRPKKEEYALQRWGRKRHSYSWSLNEESSAVVYFDGPDQARNLSDEERYDWHLNSAEGETYLTLKGSFANGFGIENWAQLITIIDDFGWTKSATVHVYLDDYDRLLEPEQLYDMCKRYGVKKVKALIAVEQGVEQRGERSRKEIEDELRDLFPRNIKSGLLKSISEIKIRDENGDLKLDKKTGLSVNERHHDLRRFPISLSGRTSFYLGKKHIGKDRRIADKYLNVYCKKQEEENRGVIDPHNCIRWEPRLSGIVGREFIRHLASRFRQVQNNDEAVAVLALCVSEAIVSCIDLRSKDGQKRHRKFARLIGVTTMGSRAQRDRDDSAEARLARAEKNFEKATIDTLFVRCCRGYNQRAWEELKKYVVVLKPADFPAYQMLFKRYEGWEISKAKFKDMVAELRMKELN